MTTQYHLIGIGGCGMAGLAQMLKQKGFKVSGSDNADSPLLNFLRNLGIQIFLGHQAEQVIGADQVIISSAIKSNNPELINAKKLHIPIIHRAQALAELTQDKKTILILGSHGKTTTTSLITSIFIAAGQDPSYAIGATFYSTGLNAYLGSGNIFIVEGDESDQSFKYFNPDVLILTNIDEDHLEAYDHDLEKLKKTYLQFIQKFSRNSPNPKNPLIILNHEDAHIRSLIPEIIKTQARIKTYGYQNSDLNISHISITGMQTSFQINQTKFSLNLPGDHNAENACAALLAAMELDIDINAMQEGLKNYQGASRRCEVHGEYLFNNTQTQTQIPFLLIEDYGHHPVEISVTIKALKKAHPNKRLVLIFQPHRYTRTQALFNSFVNILSTADVLILLDIYPASEPPIPGISSAALGAEIAKIKNKDFYLSSLSTCIQKLQEIIKPNDLVLIQGAGDIHECVGEIKDISRQP